VARILMAASHVRLSAGRESMSDELQSLTFLAGANSIFYGERLLTTPNPACSRDTGLFRRLGIRPAALAVQEDDTGAVAPTRAPAADNALFYDATRA
jgi:biotin synthase